MLSCLELFLPLVAVLMAVGPLSFLLSRGLTRQNARRRFFTQLCTASGFFLIALMVTARSFVVFAQTAESLTSGASGWAFLAAALSVGASSLGAGWAVAKAAPAALGAISENPETFGKAIIFVAMGEGIAIYGLLIAILILNKI